MKLTELGFETAEITVKKAKGSPGQEGYVAAQTISVRGISLDDLMKLFRVHGGQMVSTFNSMLAKYKDRADDLDMAQIVLQIAEQAPDLVADTIVLAMDTPNEERLAAFNVAKRLPIPVQLSCAEHIVRLTLEEHGGLGELVETVTRMVGGMNGLASKLTASKTGSLASAAPRPS